MKLSELIRDIECVEYAPYDDREISSVCVDSRECRRESLFVAVQGSRSDGADFILDAYLRGARTFVLSDKVECPSDSVVIYVKNTRKTLAELCLKFYGNPERDVLCIGITGTKGKTTTALMLKSILDFCGVKSVLISTLGVRGVEYPRPKNTTPPPTDIARILSLARDSEIKVAIIEASSQALKTFRLYGIPFHTVAFTGFGVDHVGGCEHESVLDYAAAKRTLFTSYGAKCAVVNYDDPYAAYMSDGVVKVVKCGFCDDAEMRITNFSDGVWGSSFMISGSEVKLSLAGAYNARNAALALALAREITLRPIPELAPTLFGVRVDGRLEIFSFHDRHVIVDYAHNKQSVSEITSLARRLFGGRVICVFGSVGGRAENRRRELAAAAEEGAELSVITSDDSEYELPLSVCAEIYSAFSDKSRAKIILDRPLAIEYALSVAKPGDCVLILGRGEEDSMRQGDRVIEFSDVEYVKRLQKARAEQC